MKIEEAFSVDAPVERVWRFITDPDRVAPCVPGCEDVEAVGDDSYRASVRVAVGPVKTRFEVSVELTERTAPTYVASVTRGEEGGRASTLTAHNELFLEPLGPDRTEVRYRSEISIFGRLGKFGLGIMKKKARTIGEEFARSFREQVEGAEETAPAAAGPATRGRERPPDREPGDGRPRHKGETR